MSKPKILITIEGGKVQSVCSNMDVDIIINDYDEGEDDQVQQAEPYPIFKNGEAYKMYNRVDPPLSSEEILIKEYLKEVKF